MHTKASWIGNKLFENKGFCEGFVTFRFDGNCMIWYSGRKIGAWKSNFAELLKLKQKFIFLNLSSFYARVEKTFLTV